MVNFCFGIHIAPTASARNLKATASLLERDIAVNLSWIPPGLSDRKSVIAHYRILYSPSDEGESPQPGDVQFPDLFTNEGQDAPRSVRYVGLDGDRLYTFSLTACADIDGQRQCGPEMSLSVHTPDSSKHNNTVLLLFYGHTSN